MVLSERQQLILRHVVETYQRTGQPVGSKALAALPELHCSPSTIRNDLARLEEYGLLAHPHTSAGRVPTEAGHRYVVDRLLLERSGHPRPRLELSLMRREVEEAMRITTETLAEVTNLLAVVTAPRPQAGVIRHVEVLLLQPQVVAVVVITAAGEVSKTLISFDEPVDPGLVSWAGEYLGEQVEGLELGARLLFKRLSDPTLGARERAFLDRLGSAFAALTADHEGSVYIEGTAHLFSANRLVGLAEIEELVAFLEERVSVLRMLYAALATPNVYVRIGQENSEPAMRNWALVATGYGINHRRLGTVSVIGPVAMDYPRAIDTVRAAADQLSRYLEAAYAGS